MNTALHNALSGQTESSTHPASLSEYRGATTAAHFTDPKAELSAILTGCAVYDLGFRAKISITGNDRLRWLNGMLTNNIRDLALNRGVYAFLLNPQGHILGDMYAYNRGDALLVDTDRTQIEKILATFDHYIIMDDVELNNMSEQVTAIGIAGPKARSAMREASIDFSELQPLQLVQLSCDCECGCIQCTIVRGDDPQHESYEIWLAPAHVKALWDSLLAAGAKPIGSEALEVHRILDGIPLYGVDIRERDLPQETEQVRALNFNKGCYVGQEIVERIRSRGSVHRAFTGFISPTAGKIARGTKVFLAEKEVGEITSAISLRESDPGWTVALGYIRREYAATPGEGRTEVTISGAKATVVQLPIRDAAVLRGMESAVAEVSTPAAR